MFRGKNRSLVGRHFYYRFLEIVRQTADALPVRDRNDSTITLVVVGPLSPVVAVAVAQASGSRLVQSMDVALWRETECVPLSSASAMR